MKHTNGPICRAWSRSYSVFLSPSSARKQLPRRCRSLLWSAGRSSTLSPWDALARRLFVHGPEEAGGRTDGRRRLFRAHVERDGKLQSSRIYELKDEADDSVDLFYFHYARNGRERADNVPKAGLRKKNPHIIQTPVIS
ncbi:hypothetical protein BJ322DRAFT_291660 [Thelephora terrestris]|uniref:Uncharacterized protein n=1 Tax=Thelephora terrestris TaxID=56493 RepID=A0A9P6H7N0_9AGAM|nr:hypothetical protein BJ322DRAFT_291660 [Thelephora terrestris]